MEHALTNEELRRGLGVLLEEVETLSADYDDVVQEAIDTRPKRANVRRGGIPALHAHPHRAPAGGSNPCTPRVGCVGEIDQRRGVRNARGTQAKSDGGRRRAPRRSGVPREIRA